MGVITVDTRDRKPIWEQLVENIRQLVLRGVLKPDEQLPSVRTLAGELAINPNTIQKAYAELERLGIICSMQGRGSFISGSVSALADARRSQLCEEMERLFTAAKEAGVPLSDVIGIAERIFASPASQKGTAL